MLRVVVAFAASVVVTLADNELQFEEITNAAQMTSFGKQIFDPEDDFTDAGYYETKEDCEAAETGNKEAEDTWRVKGVFDLCRTSGSECFCGETISSGKKVCLKVTYGKRGEETKIEVYNGKDCKGSFDRLDTIDLDADDRKDLASGRCVKQAVSFLGLKYEQWGRLEIRDPEMICEEEDDDDDDEDDEEAEVEKDAAFGPAWTFGVVAAAVASLVASRTAL